MLEIDIVKRLGARSVGLSLRSETGITALVGPSGAGKTSVLNMIAGVLRPDRGRIAISGRTMFDSLRAINLPPEARGCGYVFQDDRLFPHRDVRRNLLYGAKRPAGGFDDIVGLLGLEHLLERRPLTLSGGEAKRVAIGRALLSDPAALLLDEPLSGIDAERRDAIIEAIRRIAADYAIPILLVSHREEEIAALAGRVVQMEG